MTGTHVSSTEDDEESIRNIKVILLVLIIIFSVSGVLSPRLFKINNRKITYASLCLSGVLFSAGIVHLLSESVQSVNESLPGTCTTYKQL